MVTITDVEVAPDLRSARVYFTAHGDEAALERAGEGLTRASGFLRREVGRRCALRYAPELFFQPDLSFERGARIEEILSTGSSRTRNARGRREIDRPFPSRFPLSARQARRPHVPRRRRAGAEGAFACPASDTAGRSTPWRRGCCSSARVRPLGCRASSRSWTSPTTGSSGSAARRRPSTARAKRSAPTGTRRGCAARRSRRPRTPSAASFSSPRRPTRRRRSGGRKFYEMARKGETVPLMPKKVRVTELALRRACRADASPSPSPAPPERTSGRSRASSARCSAAERTWSRSAGRGSATSTWATPWRSSASKRCRRPTASQPPHAIPLSRVHFPFERVRLASLETWKIRKGQSIPARGVASKEGDWVALVGPSDEMVALGAGEPDRHPRDRSHPAEARAGGIEGVYVRTRPVRPRLSAARKLC